MKEPVRSHQKTDSEDELQHTHSAPNNMMGINQFFYESIKEGSNASSPLSNRRGKGTVSLGKYRWARRKRCSANSDEIHDLLDEMDDAKSNDEELSSFNQERRKSLKRKRIKDKLSKGNNNKGIKIVDANMISKNIIREPPKSKGIFNKQMIRYMQESDDSAEFSIESASIDKDRMQEDISPTDKRTPGLFIKKLDSESFKSNSEDNERLDFVNEGNLGDYYRRRPDSRFGVLRQGTGSSVAKTLKSMETIQHSNAHTLGSNLPKSLNPQKVKKFQKKSTSKTTQKYEYNSPHQEDENKNDISIVSHYDTQRRIFLENCKKSLKLFNSKVIEKPKRRMVKSQLSSRKEARFHKTLLNCIFKGECQRLDELLKNKTLNLEKRDERGNTPLSICVQIGSYDVLKILIQNGANVNPIQNDLGNTPLHYAIAFKFDSIVELLIKNGADQLAKNKEGKTPWEGI